MYNINDKKKKEMSISWFSLTKKTAYGNVVALKFAQVNDAKSHDLYYCATAELIISYCIANKFFIEIYASYKYFNLVYIIYV